MTKTINTSSRIARWAASAQPGSQLVYYTGFLVVDRSTIVQEIGLLGGPVYRIIPVDPADAIAQEAYRLYEQGKVELTQRRIGHNMFDYIMTKRRNK